ncbi:MAG: peptidase M23, partial [Flavobacteriaceae bacterium]
MEGKIGDYPGVCNEKTLLFYKSNCPDPNFLLKIM